MDIYLVYGRRAQAAWAPGWHSQTLVRGGRKSLVLGTSRISMQGQAPQASRALAWLSPFTEMSFQESLGSVCASRESWGSPLTEIQKHPAESPRRKWRSHVLLSYIINRQDNGQHVSHPLNWSALWGHILVQLIHFICQTIYTQRDFGETHGFKLLACINPLN